MSTVSVLAVSITIGTPDSIRSSRQISSPSLPGSIRSSSTRSGFAWWKAAIAWSPERTNTGSKPSCLRTMPSISPRDGSSSTTRTLPRKPLASSHRQPAKNAMTLGRRAAPVHRGSPPSTEPRPVIDRLRRPHENARKDGHDRRPQQPLNGSRSRSTRELQAPCRPSRSEMTLVGSSPPPREPGDGPEEAGSPNDGDQDAAPPPPLGEDDLGWVAPGAPGGAEAAGQAAPPGAPSAWQGGAAPAPGGGSPEPGWDPPPPPAGPPQPAWGPPPQPTWGAAAGWGSPGYQAPVLLPKAGSARTGPLPLHPMSFSDVLDGAFRLLRA